MTFEIFARLNQNKIAPGGCESNCVCYLIFAGVLQFPKKDTAVQKLQLNDGNTTYDNSPIAPVLVTPAAKKFQKRPQEQNTAVSWLIIFTMLQQPRARLSIPSLCSIKFKIGLHTIAKNYSWLPRYRENGEFSSCIFPDRENTGNLPKKL